VFEIGSSLREARERQKLELSEIERETRIRSRYLQALEEDRFDRLPAPAYAKGFLRTYADYLGLDAQRFVDEYNARFAPAEEPQAAAPVRIRRPGRLRRRLVIGTPTCSGAIRSRRLRRKADSSERRTASGSVSTLRGAATVIVVTSLVSPT